MLKPRFQVSAQVPHDHRVSAVGHTRLQPNFRHYLLVTAVTEVQMGAVADLILSEIRRFVVVVSHPAFCPVVNVSHVFIVLNG